MKKRTLILAVLAVVLVLSASIGSAVAYFTTYATARGGYVIHLGGRTEIEEDIVNNRKTVRIFNRAQSDEDIGINNRKTVRIFNRAQSDEDIGKYPVFVRVKAFTDSDGTLDYDANTGSLWQPRNDGYWYYQKAIYAGTSEHPEGAVTDPFVVTINLNRTLKEGEELDVIVVYDSVVAVFNADGSPDLDTAWATGNIQVVNP